MTIVATQTKVNECLENMSKKEIIKQDGVINFIMKKFDITYEQADNYCQVWWKIYGRVRFGD